MKKNVWPIVYALLLLSFTVYIALDTFVIARVYAPAQAAGAESPSASDAPAQGTEIKQVSGQVMITDNSYSDDHIQISIAEYREYNSTIYVADVTLSSAEYLQTALAQNAYGRNVTEKTSEIARENRAILAINGDYYGAQESGYVLRNGVLYRNTPSGDQEDLVIDADGHFEIIRENEVSAESLLQDGAMQVLSFGPALVNESEICVSQSDEVGRAKSSNPRTAIAMVDDLHYLFIVSDGRTDASAGLSLYELAQFARDLGAKVAYNLDGGGSSTLYFNGEIINNPTADGRRIYERSVSDIVYIGNP